MDNRDTVIQIVNRHIKENDVKILCAKFFSRNMRKETVPCVTRENVYNVIYGTFPNNEKLTQEIFEYLDFGDFEGLKAGITNLKGIKEYFPVLDKSFSGACEPLIKNYSSAKNQFHSWLKELLPRKEFKLLEEKYFQDVVNKVPSTYVIENTISYSIDKATIFSRFATNKNTNSLNEILKSFLEVTCTYEKILNVLEVEDIFQRNKGADDLKLVFINYKNKEKLDLFIEKIIDYFPNIESTIRINNSLNNLRDKKIDLLLDNFISIYNLELALPEKLTTLKKNKL